MTMKGYRRDERDERDKTRQRYRGLRRHKSGKTRFRIEKREDRTGLSEGFNLLLMFTAEPVIQPITRNLQPTT